eukprot:TRINITY_DN3781_c0_g1_i1.p1 TRINITY_DN3781_c0_g1~~TRINITY_DN3781_c0_g1_i1.p1  ORF type:complete len:109 (-),score=42.93 TRINITY_DN3781_c0_g1_i1:59-385(-)
MCIRDSINAEYGVELVVHLFQTAPKSEQPDDNNDVAVMAAHGAALPWTLHSGRPEIELFFDSINADDALGKASVVACGPATLTRRVWTLATRRNNRVRFKLHIDEFEW